MGQEVNFNAKVEAFMKANPGVSEADAKKAVREQEQAQLTAGVSGNKNEGNYGSEGTLKEPKETKSDGLFTALGTAAAIGVAAGIAGAKKGGWKGALAGFAAGFVGGGAAASMTSCTTGKDYDVDIDAHVDSSALAAQVASLCKLVEGLLNDIKGNQQALITQGETIIKLLNQLDSNDADLRVQLQASLDAIFGALVDGNSWLEAIYNKAVDNGEQNDKILAELKEIKGQINNLIDITSKLPDNVKEALGPDFQAVVAAINNNTKSVDEIKTLMKAAVLKLHVLIMQNDVQIRQNATQIKQLFEILKKLGNIEVSLGDIKDAIKELNGNFAAVFAKLDQVTQNQDEQTDVLNKILAAIQNMDTATQNKLAAILNAIMANGGKVEDLKDILNKINVTIQNMDTATQNKLTEILNAIMANGGKVEDLKDILNMINNNVVADTEQSKKNTQAIIDAMNRVGANVIVAIRQSNDGLAALFDKVIAAINNNTFNDSVNTDKILDAIKNIKIDGGQVDLSSLEAMMRELLKLTKENGNVLTSIDAKADITNATLQAILAKIPATKDYEAQLNAILEAIKNIKTDGGQPYDDSALLAMLNKLLNVSNSNNDLLVKILAAIKDHKVDVNVVVECLCNHADDGNNEGIIKEIESLIS